jgi:hypothetical protein
MLLTTVEAITGKQLHEEIRDTIIIRGSRNLVGEGIGAGPCGGLCQDSGWPRQHAGIAVDAAYLAACWRCCE